MPFRDDLRHAIRGLGRAPGFTSAAVGSIAIGLGALIAVYLLVEAVLLRPLPVAAPSELVLLARSDDPSGLPSSFPYPFFVTLQPDDGVAGVAAIGGAPVNALVDGAAEPIAAALVSGTFFDLLGVRAHAGRLLGPADDRTPGGHPLAVLGYDYWQRRFAGDRSAIGRTIQANGAALAIVGVAPPGFTGIDPAGAADLFVPMAMQAEVMASRPRLADARESWIEIVARVPEAPRAQVQASLDARFQLFLAANGLPGAPDRRLRLLDGARGRSPLRQRFARPLQILGGLSGAVLLLVCLNVTNLMLARTAARRGELALRAALGASRASLAGRVLVEALLIAVAGGALGVALARWGAAALAAIALPPAGGLRLAGLLEPHVLAVAGATALAAAIGCAIGPMVLSRPGPLATAVGVDRRQVGAGRLYGRKALQVSQIALSLLLLVGAGLFARTLANLRAVDLGIDAGHLVALRVDPTLAGYRGPQVTAFYDAITARVGALPGVQGASAAAIPLLARSDWGSGIVLDDGRRDLAPGPERNVVTPGHFRTVGTPIVAGREFTAADTAGAPRVALVNEAFARRYFDGRAIGRRIGVGEGGGAAGVTIVGVVRDGRYADVREDPIAVWYVPLAQLEGLGGSDTATRIARGMMTLYVRTAGDPAGAAAPAARAIAEVDARATVTRVRTMAQQVGELIVIERLLAALAVGFAAIATLLAAIGLYGLVAFDTGARTREIGLRLAIGATPGLVQRHFVARAAVLVGLGVAAGLALAAAFANYARSLVFGFDVFDPLVAGAAIAIVAAVTGLAAWLPARRAARVDPAVALQS